MIESIALQQENKKYTKMSEKLPTSTPLIVFRNTEKNATAISEIIRVRELIAAEYAKAVDEMVASIPEHLPESDKLAALYATFLDTMTYDFGTGNNVSDDGTVAIPDSSKQRYHRVIGEKDVWLDGKEGALLNGFGVCAGFADAFADVANKLGVPSRVVDGRTRSVKSIRGNDVEVSHAWNQVLIDGEVKNIDVTYGLFANDETVKRKKGIASELAAAGFFLVDSDTLPRIGPHHDFEDSTELIDIATRIEE